ncbi:MAG: proline hydroxylase [Pseudoalteromonas sp.]|nr:proline hydroxylase [Pseudoalteromonas sp.]
MTTNSNLFGNIAQDLQYNGYSIQSLSLDLPAVLALQARLAELDFSAFNQAGIGRKEDHQTDKTIRRDKIYWLDQRNELESVFLNYMDEVKGYMNQRLFMGLFSYECHFAHYQPGAFYKKHLDAFKGQTNRVLSTVLYLNPDWQTGDGGELVIYDGKDHEKELIRVAPSLGTFVTFLSDEFPHEVLPAKSARFSIAGWFRVNNSIGGHIDPPR